MTTGARSVRVPGIACLAALCIAVIGVSTPALAQEDVDPQAPVPLTPDLQAEIDGRLETIDDGRQDAAAIQDRIGGTDGVLTEILNLRLMEDRISLLEDGVSLARRVLALRGNGYAVEQATAAAIEVLQTHPDIFTAASNQISDVLELPDRNLGAAEQAAAEQRFFEWLDNYDRTLELMADTFELLDTLGAPMPAAEASFEERLIERTVNASIYLQMAQSETAGIRAGLRALPNDAELNGKLTVAESRIAATGEALERLVDELDAREVDVSDYRQQLLLATGEITPGAFDVGVVTGILGQMARSVRDLIAEKGGTFLVQLLLVFVILYASSKLAKLTRRVVAHGLNRSHASLSKLLHDMILATVGNLVIVLGALVALSQLGISLGPVLAGLGIAGFVIGFALQDSLSNFASGMMILFTRPYDVGDIIEVGGMLGKVDRMSLVNTTINTFDNQRIIMPNTMIWGGVIKNVTSQHQRRVDMVFGISYSDDIEKTEGIIREILDVHELILDDPEPVVRLHELGDSSVNFVVRPWTLTENYWDVYWDVTRAVKLRFDEEGISIPFPQRDVHLIHQDSPSDSDGTKASD